MTVYRARFSSKLNGATPIYTSWRSWIISTFPLQLLMSMLHHCHKQKHFQHDSVSNSVLMRGMNRADNLGHPCIPQQAQSLLAGLNILSLVVWKNNVPSQEYKEYNNQILPCRWNPTSSGMLSNLCVNGAQYRYEHSVHSCLVSCTCPHALA